MHITRGHLPQVSTVLSGMAALLLAVPCRAEIALQTTAVPMRDGVSLATDVYRDETAAPAPVVLVRTPYDRTKQRQLAERYTQAGYVSVIQDCRGTHASEGVLAPYNNEGQDGYDTIEWITRQPWCNGRVGMAGGSYVGAVQWQAAVERPPGLAAIAPQATWSSFHRNLYLGGVVRLALIAGWIAGNTPRPDGLKPADMSQALLRLPLSDVDEAIGWPMPWLDAYLTHPEPNGFWTRVDLAPHLPGLAMPALHVVGMYDFFSRESVDTFVLMQTRAHDLETRRQQRLILGPWDHGTVGKTKVGELDFGPAAAVDLFAAQLDWYDRHLKRDPAAVVKPFPPVLYFSMGDNAWHESDRWPPAGGTPTEFFLRSDGKANTRGGTGRLDREPPREPEPADRFRADPADPVPACPITPTRPLKAAVWGPVDQGSLADRADVLVYATPPLSAALRFAGRVEARLHVSTDTPDADWAVKLVDVHPDGKAYNLATGILRGRFARSLEKPEPLTPGVVVEIAVDLGPCAATILPGHRLRVDICGAVFPLYDRNPNTGRGPFDAATAIATEQVHHGPQTRSRLILPVVAATTTRPSDAARPQARQDAAKQTTPFRPEPGTFPPLEKAHAYRGELVFVDHVNRRGSIRVEGGSEVFFQHIPQPFALLPYGIVRHHGAAADLRHIPLGTMVHLHAFLPPDPNTSAVPIVERPAVDQPAENHVILLEDEPSRCLREEKVWKLKEVDLQTNAATLIGTLEPKHGGDGAAVERTMTLDAGTRIWRGRECLAVSDLVAEGTWPTSGKKSLGGQPVLLGLSWLPAGTWENRVEHQFHITDLWLDDVAMQRSADRQSGVHRSLIRTRLMPARVDAVDYATFGRATVTATLFGGMDPALYADFKPGEQAVMASAENTLKPWSSIVSSSHIASKGTLVDVSTTDASPPLGSSGIQIRFETDLIIEGIRPGRVVRVRPVSWPHVAAPREEYLIDSRSGLEDRFPSPAIFPKY